MPHATHGVSNIVAYCSLYVFYWARNKMRVSSASTDAAEVMFASSGCKFRHYSDALATSAQTRICFSRREDPHEADICIFFANMKMCIDVALHRANLQIRGSNR
ncbi:hypothetical protein PENSPDRAFT_327409 [Peniophora sp. CONT]|nr:hypothetical protein PENSPDRAFT_327409 [Peniophora sp. CONT]